MNAPQKPGKLFVISGPSGAGKSTLVRRAVAATGARVSVSATTRPRSEQEVDGRDYYFMDEAEFIAQVQRGEFLEHAQVFGHYYGTPAGAVDRQLQAGETVILEIDVQGAAQVFTKRPEAVGILIVPPSMDELRRRLVNRRRDAEDVIARRLAKAQWEIEQARSLGGFRYTVVNDDLETAAAELAALLQS